MTIADAIAVLRPLCGVQSISIEVNVWDRVNRYCGPQQEVEFTIYVVGSDGGPCLAHESAASLEDAVACVLAKLRFQPADPVGVAEAAIAGLDDPRR